MPSDASAIWGILKVATRLILAALKPRLPGLLAGNAEQQGLGGY
jgi:hypothetical protein